MGLFRNCLSCFGRPGKGSSKTLSPYESWVKERYVEQALTDPWSIKRYTTCRALRDSGVPCVLWFEDAIGYYGVKTVVFDLYVLVPDIASAASALVKRGWTDVPPNDNPHFRGAQEQLRYLRVPIHESYVDARHLVVLLSAKDWKVQLPEVSSPRYHKPLPSDRWPFVPLLPVLLDSLISKWMDTTSSLGIRSHLNVQIGYLYGAVPILNDPSFIRYLRPENGQYHLDTLAGMNTSMSYFHEHERQIRDKIREGKYQLRQCSASKDDERLFTKAVEARLLALLPPAPDTSPDNEEDEVEEIDPDVANGSASGARGVFQNLFNILRNGGRKHYDHLSDSEGV